MNIRHWIMNVEVFQDFSDTKGLILIEGKTEKLKSIKTEKKTTKGVISNLGIFIQEADDKKSCHCILNAEVDFKLGNSIELENKSKCKEVIQNIYLGIYLKCLEYQEYQDKLARGEIKENEEPEKP